MLLAFAMILLAALAHRPHHWNFTPFGAIALFSGDLCVTAPRIFLSPDSPLLGEFSAASPTEVPCLRQISRQTLPYGPLAARPPASPGITSQRSSGASSFRCHECSRLQFMSGFQHTIRPRRCTAAGFPFFWNTLEGDAF